MDSPSNYHAMEARPNKEQAILDAFAAGFADRCLRAAHDRGFVYYTLGGIRFSDLICLYNICGSQVLAARSFENQGRVYPHAKAAADQLKATYLPGFDLEVLPGDIYDCDLRLVPREGRAVVVFLDLTEMLLPGDEVYFREWILGGSLLPGDIVYLTSCVHPWLTSRKRFQKVMGPILQRQGVETSGEGAVNYVPALIKDFVSRWRYRAYTTVTIDHFFERTYQDSKFSMALNGFVLR